MHGNPLHRRGFSLVELLVVVVVISMMATILFVGSQPTAGEELKGVADVIASDLGYARSLAVSYNSSYEIEFLPTENSYVLRHCGANPSLNQLPPSPFRDNSPAGDSQTTSIDALQEAGSAVHLLAVGGGGDGSAPVTQIRFNAFGEISAPDPVTIWLSAGRGADVRYLRIVVNPVTGLPTTEGEQRDGPPRSLLPGLE